MDHLKGAMAWHDAGMSVIPVVADGSKKPYAAWKDYQSFRASRAKVERWFKTSPEQGVGLICGEVSNNLEMTEIEAVRMGGEHWDRIADCMGDNGVYPTWNRLITEGYCESTPSGGIHILYTVVGNPIPGNTKIAMDVTGKQTYAETRGEGGFVVVAPSGGRVHKTGESWTVLAGRIGEVPEITWDERCQIHDALRIALDERVLPTYERPAGASTYDKSQGERPGDAFENDPSITIHDLLLRNGWKYLGKSRGQDRYVHPLSSDMSTHSACTGWQGSPNLYAWSGLPKEDYYTKFGLLAQLEFNGDFSAAGKWLHTQGYGTGGTPVIDLSDWDEVPQQVAAPDVERAAQVESAPQPKAVRIPLKEHTDTGMAHLGVKLFGDKFRLVHEERGWRGYEAGRWVETTAAAVSQSFEKLTHAVRQEAKAGMELVADSADKAEVQAAQQYLKFANAMRQDKGAKALISRFSNQKEISVKVEDFDRNRNLLCLANGTFDMSTMTLRGHDAKDMLTRKINVPFDSSARCPEFDKYLETVIPDADSRRFIQVAMGMTLVADMKEAAFFVLHGPTGCGKSVFLNIMSEVLGEYAVTASPSTFQVSRSGGSEAGYDLHHLRGSRFASISETSEGTRLNEELIKRVTGGDAVTSRAPYQGFVTWRPSFTMWMTTNFKPNLNSDDGAVWRRARSIEFPTSFYVPGRTPDTGLKGRIVENEASGVLNWVLAGAAMYLAEGLQEPAKVKADRDEWRQEVDSVVQFLKDSVNEGTLVETPEARTPFSDLFRMYNAWAVNNYVKPLGRRRFGNRLETLGYEAIKGSGNVAMRSGLAVPPGTFIADATSGVRRW